MQLKKNIKLIALAKAVFQSTAILMFFNYYSIEKYSSIANKKKIASYLKMDNLKFKNQQQDYS